MKAIDTSITRHKIVSEAEWVEARKAHLIKEKEFTRLRDELSRERRELPWTKVEKLYPFQGPKGQETLADLFDGRSQLVVYHFMFGPGWKEGCPTCSLAADNIDGNVAHLANRDVMLLAVSRAPLSEIEAFKKRMGWRFKWVSSYGSDFNYDFHVSSTEDEIAKGKAYYNYGELDWDRYPRQERHGISVFYKYKGGEVFHTYSSYARGPEMLLGAYYFLDIVPKGRDEEALAHPMQWICHHDRYDGDYLVYPSGLNSKDPDKCCAPEGDH